MLGGNSYFCAHVALGIASVIVDMISRDSLFTALVAACIAVIRVCMLGRGSRLSAKIAFGIACADVLMGRHSYCRADVAIRVTGVSVDVRRFILLNLAVFTFYPMRIIVIGIAIEH